MVPRANMLLLVCAFVVALVGVALAGPFAFTFAVAQSTPAYPLTSDGSQILGVYTVDCSSCGISTAALGVSRPTLVLNNASYAVHAMGRIAVGDDLAALLPAIVPGGVPFNGSVNASLAAAPSSSKGALSLNDALLDSQDSRYTLTQLAPFGAFASSSAPRIVMLVVQPPNPTNGTLNFAVGVYQASHASSSWIVMDQCFDRPTRCPRGGGDLYRVAAVSYPTASTRLRRMLLQSSSSSSSSTDGVVLTQALAVFAIRMATLTNSGAVAGPTAVQAENFVDPDTAASPLHVRAVAAKFTV